MCFKRVAVIGLGFAFALAPCNVGRAITGCGEEFYMRCVEHPDQSRSDAPTAPEAPTGNA